MNFPPIWRRLKFSGELQLRYEFAQLLKEFFCRVVIRESVSEDLVERLVCDIIESKFAGSYYPYGQQVSRFTQSPKRSPRWTRQNMLWPS